MTGSNSSTDAATSNENSLQELAFAIECSQGEFKLILARCNYASLRSRWLERLRKVVEVEIEEFKVPESAITLFNPIQTYLGDRQPSALFVSGLEAVREIDRLLGVTNQVREEFRKWFHFPLILWVNDDLTRKLIRQVPDFESWATNYEFDIATDELLELLQSHCDRLFETILDPTPGRFLPGLALIDHRARLEVSSILRDLQRRHVSLDLPLEASVQFLLGRNAYEQDDLDTALVHYRQSLDGWKQLVETQRREHPAFLEAPSFVPPSASPHLPVATPLPESPSRSLLGKLAAVQVHIGLCYSRYADLHSLTDREHWTQARSSLEAGLDLFEDADRPDLVARSMTYLEEVLYYLDDWDALQALARKALPLHKTYGDPVQLAADYGFLAEVGLLRQNGLQAHRAAQKALATLAEVTAHPSPWLGTYCLLLSQLYRLLLVKAQRQLGQGSKADENLQRAIAQLPEILDDRDRRYDPHRYIRVLAILRGRYFEQGCYLEAFRLGQKQRLVERQYGFRAFIGAGCLQPHAAAVSPVQTQLERRDTIPEEIKASGRQQDVERLLERVSRPDRKLTIIYGRSGVGKSSLVNAGLVPALQGIPIGTREGNPLVVRVYTDWMGVLAAQLDIPAEERAFVNSQRLLQELQRQSDRRKLTVLILDQFEEFFFVCLNPRDRREFYDFLRDCLDLSFVNVILSIREDYLHYLLECDRLTNLEVIDNDILNKNVRYYLGNFSPQEARNVIHRLTERSYFELESDLIDELVRDLAGEWGEVRPIELQIVGAQLQTENITTLDRYLECGPKQKLVERFLEQAIRDCGPENESAARLVLFELTDKNGTRPLKTRSELGATLGKDADKLDLVLEIFTHSGLVFLIPEVPTHRYQLVHDYLVPFIRTQQELADRAEREALQQKYEQVSEERLLLMQLAQAQEKQKKSEVRLRQILLTALIGAIVAVGAFAYMTREAVRARRNAEIAQIEARSSEAKALRLSNDRLSALIAGVKAGRKLEQTDAPAAVETETTELLQDLIYEVREINRLVGHDKSVVEVSFSPNGNTIASASSDNTVKLWRPDGSVIATLEGHETPITSVRWTPQGDRLVTASLDGTVKLWHPQGRIVQSFQAHDSFVTAVAFSPDGGRLATASADNTIKLWQRDDTGQFVTTPIRTLKGHQNWVLAVEFSPDGTTLASASRDNTVKLWNLANSKVAQTLSGHTDGAFSVAFSPDGQTLASASADETIILWNREGKRLMTLEGHAQAVREVAFSPDGQTLASASEDRTIKLWNRGGMLLDTLEGHQDWVLDVSFSADNQLLASASKDRTLKLWSLDTPFGQRLTGHQAAVFGVAFSPEGDRIVTGSEDKTIKLWTRRGQLLNTLTGHTDAVTWVEFAPDGQTLASASRDGTIKLWSREGRLIETLSYPEGKVWSAMFSADGDRIVSASGERSLQIWNRNNHSQIQLQLPGKVNAIALSPDSQRIASANADGNVRLWSPDGRLIQVIPHDGAVESVSFSADDSVIASVTQGRIIIWTLEGDRLQTIQPDTAVNSVSFSPDGRVLASLADKSVTVWRPDGTKLKTERFDDTLIKASFSPDGETLALASRDRTTILATVELLPLDRLLMRSCTWLGDYLRANPQISASDRAACASIASP